LAISPNDVWALLIKGSLLLALGNDTEAQQYFYKALAINPNFPLASNIIAYGLALYSDDPSKALEIVDKYLKNNPEDIYYMNTKALLLNRLGKYNEAIELYDKVLKTAPTYIDPLNNKAIALANLGRYQEAIELFDKAIAKDPNNVDALNNKGAALDSLGRYQEAIEYYDKVLAIDPNDTYALNNKGAALDSLGRYQEAIEYYDKALGTKPIEDIQYSNKDLKIEPNYISASQIMKFTDFNRYEDLNRLQYVGLSKDSENTIIIVNKNKGVALYNLGRYMEANDNFDRILKVDSNHITALYYKGLCLEKLGQLNQAISYKNRVAEIDSTYKGEEAEITLFKPPLAHLFGIK
jgi:superkiller protein 3